MRVSAPNQSIQNNLNTKKGNAPSFQANLFASDWAKDVLKKELTEFHLKCGFFQKLRHFGLKKFNFEKIFSNYKNAIEKATQSVEGDIELVINTELHTPKNRPEIRFNPPNWISTLKSGSKNKPLITLAATDILPDRLFSEKNPMKHAVMLTEFKLSNLFNMNNRELNPFEKLLSQKLAN